jgi:hypothetical protein
MKTWLALALVAGLTLCGASACRGRGDELSAADAAEALKSEPGFTTREGSLIGRQLVEVTLVRRIGRSSTEVEFTWRDHPLPPGQTGPLKTSMALFRMSDEGRWSLASLYKVG